MRPAAPLIIAHRGDSAQRPENTLAAFAGALEVGATVVELDVQLTRDAELVVLHDDTLDRTTDGTGPVHDRTLAEIRALSAGYPALFGDAWAGERVPTLAGALAMLRGRARVMIEIKPESVADLCDDACIEARTVEVVSRLGMVDQVALISFDQRAMLHLRDLAPDVTRGRLFERTTPDEVLQAAAEAGCSLVMPHRSQLSDDLSARVHAEGLMLATWVVDDPQELKRVARFGVYGVGSNNPGLLLQALADGLLD